MKFHFFVIVILTIFLMASCKVYIDVTTPGSDFDVPANTTSGADSWAEVKINLDDSVKNDDNTVTLHKFSGSYDLTNLSSTYAMSNSDLVISLVGEARDNEVRVYLDSGMGGNKPLFLRGTYNEYSDYAYLLKAVNIDIGQSIKNNSISIPTSMIDSILKQGYFYVDSKVSITWSWPQTPPNTNIDKLGIRNFEVNVQADKYTGSFLFLENIL